MSKDKLVILFGAPGSGKSVQSNLLTEKRKMLRLESSKALEKVFLNTKEKEIEINDTIYNLEEQEKRWREGFLCEDEFVSFVIKDNLDKLREKEETILIDGYPRTESQAKIAVPIFLSYYSVSDILVIFLNVDEEESIKRNTNRRVCSLMRHSIIDTKETKNLTICPIDGSSLERRAMDEEKIIKKRLRLFKEKTFPVLDYFASQKITTIHVDGSGTISDVFFRTLKEIEDFGV